MVTSGQEGAWPQDNRPPMSSRSSAEMRLYTTFRQHVIESCRLLNAASSSLRCTIAPITARLPDYRSVDPHILPHCMPIDYYSLRKLLCRLSNPHPRNPRGSQPMHRIDKKGRGTDYHSFKHHHRRPAYHCGLCRDGRNRSERSLPYYQTLLVTLADRTFNGIWAVCRGNRSRERD